MYGESDWRLPTRRTRRTTMEYQYTRWRRSRFRGRWSATFIFHSIPPVTRGRKRIVETRTTLRDAFFRAIRLYNIHVNTALIIPTRTTRRTNLARHDDNRHKILTAHWTPKRTDESECRDQKDVPRKNAKTVRSNRYSETVALTLVKCLHFRAILRKSEYKTKNKVFRFCFVINFRRIFTGVVDF